jgi:hypothetical protein
VGPEGWLRVTVGTPEDNATFRAALAEVAALDGMMVREIADVAPDDSGGTEGDTP